MPIPSIPTMFVSGKRKKAPKILQTIPLKISKKAPFPTLFFIKISCEKLKFLFKDYLQNKKYVLKYTRKYAKDI